MANRRGAIVAALAVLALMAPSTSPAFAADEVDIPDPAFRACLQEILGASVPLTEDNLGTLKSIVCPAGTSPIHSIAGAEHLTSAKTLVFHDSLLSDLSPIEALPQLYAFGPGLHPDADPTPLAALHNVQVLHLSPVFGTQDLSVISGMGHLRWLQLSTSDAHFPDLGGSVEAGTVSVSGPNLTRLDGLEGLDAELLQVLDAEKLTDVAALSGSRITEIRMGNSRGTPDLGPLKDVDGLEVLSVNMSGNGQLGNIRYLTSLRSLDLGGSAVTDLSTLQPPSTLERLRVTSYDPKRGYDLANLGPQGSLRQLKELRTAYAYGVTSLEALRGTTSLTLLEMPDSRVRDISPLSEIPDGATLDLRRNRIDDFSPLSGWSGNLTATDQAVVLPTLLVDVPAAVELRATDGGFLKPSARNDPSCDYVSGMLTCSQSSGSFSLYFYSGPTEADSPITMGGVVQVERLAFTKVGTPSISETGTVRVGQAVIARPGTWSPQPDRFTYQWYTDGAPIPGATSPTYTPDGTEGELLALEVTAHRLSHYDTSQWARGATVIAGTLVNTPTPTVSHSGRLATDTVLKAKPGTWDAGVTLKYQWQRDSKNVTGATSASYKVTASDVGHKLRVRVTGSKAGYTAVSRYSSQLTPARARFSTASAPKIGGTRAVGSKLTASVPWTPKATLKYQWYRNGKAIKGATKSTYTLKTSDLGDRFKVKVTATMSGYTTLTRTSASTARVAKGKLTAPPATIGGTPAAGQTLAAYRGTWQPGGVRFSYQWYRDGRAIKGATAKTYRVKATDTGHNLTVRITGRKAGYTTTGRTSAPVAVR